MDCVSASKKSGTVISAIATPSCPGGPTVSQRKPPSSGSVAVVAERHVQLLGVEGEGFVLVVHPDVHVGELVEHVRSFRSTGRACHWSDAADLSLENCSIAAAPTPAARRSGCGRGVTRADARRGTPSACSRRSRPKLVVNDPTLRNPTVKQMSATLRSVERRSAAARSRRRVKRYWCGVSPNARRNSRLKCAGESRAARASTGTSSGSR